MNIPKLRGKMVEMGYNVDSLAIVVGVKRATFYKRLNNCEKFTIGEAQKIKKALNLTNDEASAIFFEE